MAFAIAFISSFITRSYVPMLYGMLAILFFMLDLTFVGFVTTLLILLQVRSRVVLVSVIILSLLVTILFYAFTY